MADNLAITAGAGTTIATDDVGGVHYQKVKLFNGTADSSAEITGDVDNGLDVDVTRVIPGTAATNLGKAIDAVAGATDTGLAPLAIRDDALAALTPIEGDYVPLRTDANGALWVHDDALDAAIAGSELQVDVVAALPTGSNVIGALSANQSVNVAQINGVTVLMGNGVSGTGVQRVTLASDSTGQVVLATGSATIGALTANQSVNVAQMGGTATSMNTGVRDAGTQRVTIATNDVVPASQSGTWTVQPGNTANTTAWLVKSNESPDATSTYAPTNATSTAYETNRVAKASAGVLFCINGYNTR